jgi:hypothetical protein
MKLCNRVVTESIYEGENWESEKNDNDNSFPANKVNRSYNRSFLQNFIESK